MVPNFPPTPGFATVPKPDPGARKTLKAKGVTGSYETIPSNFTPAGKTCLTRLDKEFTCAWSTGTKVDSSKTVAGYSSNNRTWLTPVNNKNA